MWAVVSTVVFDRKNCYNDAERDLLAIAMFFVTKGDQWRALLRRLLLRKVAVWVISDGVRAVMGPRRSHVVFLNLTRWASPT